MNHSFSNFINSFLIIKIRKDICGGGISITNRDVSGWELNFESILYKIVRLMLSYVEAIILTLLIKNWLAN